MEIEDQVQLADVAEVAVQALYKMVDLGRRCTQRRQRAADCALLASWDEGIAIRGTPA